MVSSWSDFLVLFGIGFSSGFLVGFLCLAVRRIRMSFENGFKRAMFS